MYVLHDVLWNLWHCFCLMRHFVFAWILSDGHGVVLQPACVSQYEFSANSLEWPGHVSHRETVKRPLFWSCGYFCAVQGILGNAQAFRRKHSEMSLPLRFCKNMSSVILLNYSSSLLFSLLMWSTFLSPLTGHHVMSNIYQLWAGECEHVHVCVCLCSTCVTLCTDETIAETFKDLVDLWNPLHNAMILPGIVAEPHTGSSVRLLLEVKGQML